MMPCATQDDVGEAQGTRGITIARRSATDHSDSSYNFVLATIFEQSQQRIFVGNSLVAEANCSIQTAEERCYSDVLHEEHRGVRNVGPVLSWGGARKGRCTRDTFRDVK